MVQCSAVAVRVEEGAVVMVHRSSSRIEELRMNLARPDTPVANSWLRNPRYGPKMGPRLSGQLYRGHARPG